MGKSGRGDYENGASDEVNALYSASSFKHQKGRFERKYVIICLHLSSNWHIALRLENILQTWILERTLLQHVLLF